MPQIIKKIIRSFRKDISLAVIFVEYDRPACGGSDKVFATLQSYLSGLQGCRITYFRINNRDEKLITEKKGNVSTVGGDNRYREFSGWQKGVDVVRSINLRFDLALFANDMFLKPGKSFLQDYADIHLLQRSLSGKKIIGRIDSTGGHYTAYNYDVSQWICTNCFLAPMTAIEQLGDMVSVRDNLNDFLPEPFPGPMENPTSFFRDNAPLNHAYKAWLIEWLTERWHSKFPINAANWDLFRSKVRNILNESLLTARLSAAGFKAEKYGDKFYY